MLEEFADRIQNAKDKQYLLINRFHIGDTVYPFWLKNFIVYGTVIDIDVVARKVICDFNGVMRQFCPEDLMLVNPNLVQINSKSRKASKVETQLSPDTDNGISAVCKECGGEIAVSFNEMDGMTDFVCTSCGKRIPENKLSKKSKKAMRRMANLNNPYCQDIDKIISFLRDIKDIYLSYYGSLQVLCRLSKKHDEGFYNTLVNLFNTMEINSDFLGDLDSYNKLIKVINEVFILWKNKANEESKYDEIAEKLYDQTVDFHGSILEISSLISELNNINSLLETI